MNSWFPPINERKERSRVELPSQLRLSVALDDEGKAPPPLPARKSHAHLVGHLQSPTSPVLLPRSPRTSPRPSPRSSPLISPNLSPENSPHPSPRLPRHRLGPIDMLPESDEIPPKLPARSKKARSEDHFHIHVEGAARPNLDGIAAHAEIDETRARFPYTGIEHADNQPAVSTADSANSVTYADLSFPKQDKDKSGTPSHLPIGPRLSLNDKEIDDFTAESNGSTFDDVDANFQSNCFSVREDPFEGANPFEGPNPLANDKVYGQQLNDNVCNRLPIATEIFLRAKSSPGNLPQTSKSLENLTVDNASEKCSEIENVYTEDGSRNSLPRCYSNPSYISNSELANLSKANTFPPRRPSSASDGEPSIEFNEEDFLILMSQGYTREQIAKALITSENNFAMARKILRSYHGTRPHHD